MHDVKKISVTNIPEEFLTWLKDQKKLGQVEISISKGVINHLYVRVSDDGNWDDVQFGRIICSEDMSMKEFVRHPRLVNGTFIENYNVS